MKPDVKLLLMTAITLTRAPGGHGYYGYEKQPSMQDKVDKLGEDMQKLNEKMDRVVNNSGKIDELFDRVTGVFHDRSSTAQDTDPQNSLPVTLEKVWREPVEPDRVRYAVRYQRNRKKIVLTSTIPFDRHIRPSVKEMEGNVEEASVIFKREFEHVISAREHGEVSFSFYDKDITTELTVHILTRGYYSPDEKTRQEADIEENMIPHIEVDHLREIVYEEGEDVIVQVTVDQYSTYSEYSSPDGLHQRPFLYDLDSQELLPRFGSVGNFSSLGTVKAISEKDVFNVTLKTSEQRKCGLIDFVNNQTIDYYTPTSGSSMLLRFAVRKILQLRPSSQRRPFPKTMIKFLETNNYDSESENATVCDVEHDLCSANCLAVGGNIFDVIVHKELPDDTMELVEKTKRWDSGYPYIRPADFEFTPPAIDEIEKDQKFVCTAISFDGFNATKEVLVKYTQKIEILRDRISAEVAKNDTMDTITMRCSATGRPLPNITFSLYFDLGNINEITADKVVTTENEKVVTATKTFSWEPFLHDSGRRNRLWAAECMAESLFNRYSSDIQGFALPDTV